MRLGIRGKIFLFAVIAWAFIFGLYAVYVYRERTAQTERMALTAASLLAREIQADRQLYTSTVVKRALEAGLTVTANYHNLEKSIPIPETFLKEVADFIGEKDGFYIEIKGVNPINPVNGPKDAFERAGLESFIKGSDTKFHSFEDVKGRWSLRYMVSDTATSQVCVDCHNSTPGAPKRDYKVGELMGAVVITLPVEGEAAMAASDVWRSVGYGLLLVAVVGILGLAFISRIVTRPALNIADAAGRLAAGDLTWTLPVRSRDELGDISETINGVVKSLNAIIEDIRRAADEAVEISGGAREMTRLLIEGSGRQGFSLDEVAKNVEKTGSSLSDAAKAAENLAAAAEKGSASLLELGAGINDVAENTEALFTSVEGTAHSMREMSGSVMEMTENIEDLSSAVSRVSSSMVRIGAGIKEIEVNATEACKYSEDCIKDANAGMESVTSTIRGVLKVKEITKDSMLAITSLCEKVKEIGKTLEFIRGVSEETNLLAINAAITAAQSGEHGKSFAVVANEIKDLAERTSTSAREVSEIIQAVETESEKASEAMAKGVESVEDGVRLSVEAGEGLKKIVQSAERSTGSIKEIARAAGEQTGESRTAVSGTEKLSEMTRKIVSAAQEHSRGSELVNRASGRLSEIAYKVKASTRAEAALAEDAAGTLEEVLRLTSYINGVIREQSRNVSRVIESLSSVRKVSSENLDRAAVAGKALEDMVRLNNELMENVKRFKLKR